jgi:hypothetical protein
MKRIWGIAALLVAMGGALVCLGTSQAGEEGFKDVFNGKNFDGWKFVLGGKETKPGKTFTIKKGVIIVSGSPNGYMVTDKSFKNYIIRYDWQYKRPSDLKDDESFTGNSGLLVHIQGLPKGTWPPCVEVQGENKTHARIFAIGQIKGKHEFGFKGTFDAKALKKARKPVGEWNTTEAILLKDGTITAKVNGTQISTGKGDLTEGPFGLQSEGAEIHFKNIKVKVLD